MERYSEDLLAYHAMRNTSIRLRLMENRLAPTSINIGPRASGWVIKAEVRSLVKTQPRLEVRVTKIFPTRTGRPSGVLAFFSK